MPTWLWAPIVVIAALWCALAFAVWPFTNCRRCQGNGRWRNPNPPNWRAARFKWMWCSVCHGTGRRLWWSHRKDQRAAEGGEQ